MHPDECRSTHLLLPPSSVRSRGGRSKSTICTRSTTIHPSLPNLGNDSRRVSKVSHSTFPPSPSPRNSLRKIHSPLRTHTRYIILIFRLSSSSPSQFSLTVIIHHPSIRQFSFEPFPNGISLLLSTGPSSILRFRENCQSRCDTLDGCRNGAAQGAQEKLCD